MVFDNHIWGIIANTMFIYILCVTGILTDISTLTLSPWYQSDSKIVKLFLDFNKVNHPKPVACTDFLKDRGENTARSRH